MAINSRKYIILALMLSTTMVYAQKKNAKTAQRRNAKTEVAPNPMNARQQENYENMLPNTQRIFVVDSSVVDIDKVAEAMPLSSKYGELVSYNKFFDTDAQPNQYVFVNGFGNRCYYTELAKDSVQHLYMRNRMADGWGEPQRIKEIDTKLTSISYPFLSSDGQTLYVSGVSDDGLGKRDIYMAKYNAEEGKFFEPENIGLPFNSYDDDFMYVESDAERFAWFASTRRQPEGKACVYVFALPEQRSNYNEDDIAENRLKSLAAMMRIRDTWQTPELRDKALNDLEKMKAEATRRSNKAEVVAFVVNDNTVYTDIKEFRSDATRQQYYEVVRLGNDLKNKQRSLEALRVKYHNASENDRTALTRNILQLERQTEETRQQLKNTEAELRKAENQLL